MKYGSVCSGIEAATSAWHPLDWEPAFFSEIEAFPSAVLAHHYPAVPNLGDMTKFKEWPDANINVLVGGTPCQSFSVAGLRKGLDDPRGNLMLTFGAIAAKYRPKWLVWENVPGVLSANGGRDFGTFLGMLGQLGYGFAYRVLDAQYFGLAQRRKRVFVVGYLGDWQPAAAVLFERHSLSGHPAPSREAKQRPACDSVPSIAGSLDTECGGGKLTHQSINNGHVIGTITARMFNALGEFDVEEGALLPVAFGWQNSPSQGDSLSSHITPTLDKSKTPAVAIRTAQTGSNGHGFSEGMAHTLDRAQGQAVAVSLRGREGGATAELGDEVGNCLRASSGGGDKPHVMTAMQVRRLTPVECERLQGFPDNYTAIPYRNKPSSKCPDGPRYKALGNSMAVPVMRWIGDRIQTVDDVYRAECDPVEAQA